MASRLLGGTGIPTVAGLRRAREPSMAGRNIYAALVNLSLEDEAAAAAKALRSTSHSAASTSTATGPLAPPRLTRTEQLHQQASQPPLLMAEQPSQQEQDKQQQATSKEAPASSTAPEASSSGAAAPKRKRLRNPLVWIDLEMTGLDLGKDTILEIACLVTDGDLNTVIEGPCLAIHQSEEVLASMNDWCKEHHGNSGLTQRCRDSTVGMADAQAQVLAFIAEHAEYQSAQLAGNSVHVDKAFLRVHMPDVVDHLHYRIVDVSTVQELCRRWAPKVHRNAPKKVSAHTALSDIKESLKELQYYKQVLWKQR